MNWECISYKRTFFIFTDVKTSTLKIYMIRSSESSIYILSKWRYNPEDGNILQRFLSVIYEVKYGLKLIMLRIIEHVTPKYTVSRHISYHLKWMRTVPSEPFDIPLQTETTRVIRAIIFD
jgi:hypothetical protein